MGSGTTKTHFKHKDLFFVFADKTLFLFPESEYSQIQKPEEGYVCLKRKYLPDVTDRDVERIICIVCHEEATLEDFVSPMCREMHFVLCRECVEYLRGRTDKREVVCPYCREKKSDKAYQEEILGILFSLMSQQTLLSLELRPDMEVETVTRLTQETKVVLSNIAISDALFFKLLSKTVVEVRNKISLVGHDDSLGRCIGESDWRTSEPINICFKGYTSQEMKQVYESITTIPRKSIQIGAKEVRTKGDSICVLLKLLDSVDGYIPDLSLETSRKKYIEEITETESNLGWIGNMKKLKLIGPAVEALPRLKLRQENMMEELVLDAYTHGYITKILRMENSSIWVGKVRKLLLKKHAIQILPKLKFHDENEMEELGLSACTPGHITEILKMERNSIWVGKVKVLKLENYTMGILPKLGIHKENELEELDLNAYIPGYIAEILRMENKSIWIGKMKVLKLKWYAAEILPKIRIHEENEMEEFGLDIESPEQIAGILKAENNSIWIGKMKMLELEKHAVEILPKLRIHEENVMDELSLEACFSGQIIRILRMENKSVWVGKVKTVRLKRYAVEILPKLIMHSENELEELSLTAYNPEHIAGILQTENNSIWVGKVKVLQLESYAVGILPKLGIHEENEMEELDLSAYGFEYIAKILRMESNSIWVGRVKKLSLKHNGIEILSKLRIHGENVLEELSLSAKCPTYITGILKEEDRSIWTGKMKRLVLERYAVEILSKLRIHGENEMEELRLRTYVSEKTLVILRAENSSIWVGKVKRLELHGHIIELLPKLRFHKENEAKMFVLDAYYTKHITEMLKMEKESIWIGKVKRLELKKFGVKILPKLKLHRENEMEELFLEAYRREYIAGILEMKNKSIRIGRMRKISLKGYYAEEIFSKLDFTEIAPGGQEEIGCV
ncbi:MAG: uncharacterized protein A8A55_1477 [Amphiamblys sp. WSBS2006]|nr:MAG: uncharacterized protein A8A55_1477 [Amphiamblys sp. WSBS2006]